jgi:hypothetical protein
MRYSLEEHFEDGEHVVLGDPFADLRVANVVASRRAFRTGRIVVVKDVRTGREVARYAADGAPLHGSVKRMRAVADLRRAVDQAREETEPKLKSG